MHRTVLDNGVEVLSERIPGVRSTAVGVWVRQGGAHESEETLGASHLLEHMVFKGTESRSARDIALSLESLGGSLDAYTSREHTAYQARVLDTHLPEAMDVLADLVCRPALRDEDLALEREVVLEEIAQVEDTPDDVVFELHGDRLFGPHPYGRSILGTADSVAGMSVATLQALHQERYLNGSLVVAAAGSVDHDDLVGRARHHFGHLKTAMPPVPVPDVDAGAAGSDLRVPRDSAQSHVVFGTVGPAHADPLRIPLILLSSALGGGMSSRLFQRVREELGLCYSVFTYQSFYGKAGTVGVYVGTRRATEDAAVDVIREELARVSAVGLDAEELATTKQQVKGQIMLSLESTGARLYRLTTAALNAEPFLTLDEILARVEAVTAEEITEAAARWYDPGRHLVLRLGPS